eukprot:145717-Rhodomonas_salina.1
MLLHQTLFRTPTTSNTVLDCGVGTATTNEGARTLKKAAMAAMIGCSTLAAAAPCSHPSAACPFPHSPSLPGPSPCQRLSQARVRGGGERGGGRLTSA